VDYAREMKRLREKIDAGAEMIMTQPIYDAAVMRKFLDDVMQVCSVLQCVAVYCNVLQCVAVCCSVLQRVAACCNVLQCVAFLILHDVMQLPRPVPVLMGLCPLVSSRNAEFLHNEVPGMSVPQPIRDRMSAAGGGPSGIAEGVKVNLVKSRL